MALLAFVERVAGLMHVVRRIKAVITTISVPLPILSLHTCIEHFVLGHPQSFTLLQSDINLHDIKCQPILHILTDIVSILAMAITDAEVPQILNFGEVFDDEEVVLVRLRDTVGSLAWTG